MGYSLAEHAADGSAAVLFVALGEVETPAFAVLADALRHEGFRTHVVTWHPRLADERTVESLATMRSEEAPIGALKAEMNGVGIAVPAMAADYDRDWRFAPVIDKAQHVHAVHAALTTVFDRFRPTHVISSLSGEAVRIVADAIAVARGVKRLYFAALPASGRFVLVPSLDSPLVPWTDDGRPHPSGVERTVGGAPSAPLHGPLPEPKRIEPAHQAPQLSLERRRLHPRGRRRRAAVMHMRDRMSGAGRGTRLNRDTEDTLVLYLAQDEQDFQLAFGERHALPQSSLLLYLSSVMPPGYRLMVKPDHPGYARRSARQWGNVSSRPNVTALGADVSAAEAIEAADVVFTVSSSVGYRALLAGRPVVCYGTPFYSGRGLTIDVADPRDIGGSLSKALNFLPDEQEISRFAASVESASWPGRASPLELEPANLHALGLALRDALSC